MSEFGQSEALHTSSQCHGSAVLFSPSKVLARMFSYLSSLIYGPKEVPTRPPLTRQPRPLPGVEALAASLSSSTALLLPHGDTADAYLEARWDRTWNIDVIGTPSGIVVAEGEDDVVETVRYAAKHLKTVSQDQRT